MRCTYSASHIAFVIYPMLTPVCRKKHSNPISITMPILSLLRLRLFGDYSLHQFVLTLTNLPLHTPISMGAGYRGALAHGQMTSNRPCFEICFRFLFKMVNKIFLLLHLSQKPCLNASSYPPTTKPPRRHYNHHNGIHKRLQDPQHPPLH